MGIFFPVVNNFSKAKVFILFRQIFCDFGENFTVHDVKGEQPLSAMIASISKVIIFVFTLYMCGI